MSTLATPPHLPQPQKKPRGCFFYGCLTAIVLGVVVGVGGFFVIRYALDQLAAMTEQYTDTAPMSLPESTLPAAEYQQLRERVTGFGKALDAGERPAPLVLAGDDLNALIANDPSWQWLRGKLHVSLAGDQVIGEVALPLDDFVASLPRMDRLKGRYLNGKATFKVVLVDELLVVSLRSLEVKGQSLPPEVMEGLRTQNLFDPQRTGSARSGLEATIARLESIRIADGKLTIVPKAR